MNAARLQEIEEIYHAAVEVPAADLEAFFQTRCGDDYELRREVESLLSFDKTSDSFIDTSMESFAAEMFSAEDEKLSLIGKNVGKYNILSFLGAGGMGEVYLANEPRLGRKVALKLLHKNVADDAERRRRFEMEARTASALNHPNILTVHEFGEMDGAFFLAAELVEGDTLRELINRRELDLADVIGIAEQTAFALTAAHRSGIVHRDIKPENVMLRHDGIVKVLDFGLAKLTETPKSPAGDNLAITIPGLIMGTVAYMSPEQARGLADVDARADVWSLGVVTYQMLTGQVPFTGETTSDVIAAILRSEPEPLRAYLPGLPAGVEAFVNKALQKDRAKRYQTAEEMLADLRHLKGELAVREKFDLSGTALFPADAAFDVSFVRVATANPKAESGARMRRSKRRSYTAWAFGTIMVVLIAGIGIFVLPAYLRSDKGVFTQTLGLPPVTQKRLTTNGKAAGAVTSPDGSAVAYVTKEAKTTTIYVRQIDTRGSLAIVKESVTNIHSPTFSPNGEYIFYIREDEKQSIYSTLFRVPVTGGEPEQILRDVDHGISFSPDGTEFVFRRENPAERESYLMIADADGKNERRIAVRKRPDGFMNAPVWSPDGKTVASVINEPVSDALEFSVVAIDLKTGEQNAVGSTKWRWTRGITWMPDGRSLLFVGQDSAAQPNQVWNISFPGGELSKITSDFNEYEGISISRDGGRVVSLQTRQDVNMFVAPANDPTSVKQITSLEGRTFYGLSYTPGGDIVYASNADGNRDIWIMHADGTGQTQLTKDQFVSTDPVVSRDGKFIVYRSERSSRGNIWRMNIDGSVPVQLTGGTADFDPVISGDSKWVIYSAPAEGTQPRLWKVSIDGGEPVQLTHEQSLTPEVSPDGSYIATMYFPAHAGASNNLTIFDAASLRLIKTIDIGNVIFKWAPNSRSLIYIDRAADVSNLSSQALDGSVKRSLSSFKSDQIFDFAYSHDGRNIAMVRGSLNNSVVVLSNVK